jgi:hypothetical protein
MWTPPAASTGLAPRTGGGNGLILGSGAAGAKPDRFRRPAHEVSCERQRRKSGPPHLTRKPRLATGVFCLRHLVCRSRQYAHIRPSCCLATNSPARSRQGRVEIQRKTGRPVQFELLEPARASILEWLRCRGGLLRFPKPDRQCCSPSAPGSMPGLWTPVGDGHRPSWR